MRICHGSSINLKTFKFRYLLLYKGLPFTWQAFFITAVLLSLPLFAHTLAGAKFIYILLAWTCSDSFQFGQFNLMRQ